MSTPAKVTEAHRTLAAKCHDHAYSFFVQVDDSHQEDEQIKSIAQLIADSEAKVVAKQVDALAILTLRWDKVDRAERAEREKVRLLRSALENLCDEQNGAPLETRRDQWQMAMDETGVALAVTEDAK